MATRFARDRQGSDQPVTGNPLHTTLGSDVVTQLARTLGMPPQELSAELADVLPGVVDKLTPDGTVPPKP